MFCLNKKGDVEYYTIEAFEETGLVNHCFTTKKGGVSKGCYESMNLRLSSEDLKENVIKNFHIICDTLGFDYNHLVFSNQVHEDNILYVGKNDWGNGLKFDNKFKSADGLITDERDVVLVTFYADCVPLFFLDKRKKVIALSHSGWKGTFLNIAGKTVEKFKTDFGSDPQDILVGIGPSIRECHFEVGEDVRDKFLDKFGADYIGYYDKKPHINLQKIIIDELKNEGILLDNITDANICTFCNSENLYSHRKTQWKRGNLAAFMSLR